MKSKIDEDILKTFETDDQVILLTANNICYIEIEIVFELAQLFCYHDKTTDLKKSPFVSPLDLGINMAILLKQPFKKKRLRLFSSISKLLLYLKTFFAYLHLKNDQNQKAKLSFEKKIKFNIKS